MADIDQIIAGGAGSTSRADFSALADIPAAYWKGKENRNIQDNRDVFKGGVPTNPDGSVNYGAMRDALFKLGNIQQGTALDNLDIQRQQLKFGQQQSQGIQNFEGGGQPQPAAPLLPPSANRTVTPNAPATGSGVNPQAQGAPTPSGAPTATVMKILDAQGIPNDQLGAASTSLARQLGVDPNEPIDTTDPRVRNVLGGFIRQIKTAGVGNIIPPGQPAPDQPLQQPPQVMGPGGAAQPNAQGGAPPQPGPPPGQPQPPQAMPQGQPGPAPVTAPLTGTAGPSTPSRVDQAIAFYSGIMSNPISPKQNVELAKTRLESLQKSAELTPEQKNYVQAKLQGFPGTMQEYQTQTKADEAYATKSVESNLKKYESIQTAGERARVDLPQLELARNLTEDPAFYSGVGEKYNLLLKRAVTALGGDPNTAAPQEAFRKIVSNSILDQIKGMAGTGPIRVAEMKIMQEAAANPDNTPQANRLLLELSSRLQKRSADIADMAQAYNGGRLDSGFDKKVAAYDRANPMISDKEIPDFRKIIGGPRNQAAPAATTTASAGPDPAALAEARRRGLIK